MRTLRLTNKEIEELRNSIVLTLVVDESDDMTKQSVLDKREKILKSILQKIK